MAIFQQLRLLATPNFEIARQLPVVETNGEAGVPWRAEARICTRFCKDTLGAVACVLPFQYCACSKEHNCQHNSSNDEKDANDVHLYSSSVPRLKHGAPITDVHTML
jgi:hypothetical protein